MGARASLLVTMRGFLSARPIPIPAPRPRGGQAWGAVLAIQQQRNRILSATAVARYSENFTSSERRRGMAAGHAPDEGPAFSRRTFPAAPFGCGRKPTLSSAFRL